MESLNAHLISEGFSKSQRVEKLNKIAISQMRILSGGDVRELGRKDDKKGKLINDAKNQ